MISASRLVPANTAFAIDPEQSNWFNLRIHGGWLAMPGAPFFQATPSTDVLLAASATNFVEANPAGVISSNTVGFTIGYSSLYVVVTDTVGMIAIEDWRFNPGIDRSLTPTSVVASDSVIGGVPVLFTQAILDASADTDIIVRDKLKVVDFWFLNTGIAAHATLDTIQLKNGTTAMSNAVAKTATVNGVVRVGTLDPAQTVVAAGGTLRITAAKNTNVAGVAHILAAHVA